MIKVVIDAGHYPNTKGKRCPDDSMREYHFNNAVANYVAALLSGYKDVVTKFTHSDKRDVPLAERVSVANNWNADLFVSIHANAFGSGWNDANGIETFVCVAASAESRAVANEVQAALIAKTGLANRGVKVEDYYVIKHTNAPAILAECGFMTNKKEAALLKSDAYRRTCAEAIVEGIVKVFALKKAVPEPQPTPPPLTPVPAVESSVNVPEWAQEAVKAGLARGAFSSAAGSTDFYRIVTILNRLGLFEQEDTK